jgi:hypothetical protein
LIYAAFVAGVGWLRFSIHGFAGIPIALLFGGAIGLNWPLLVGLYNFLFGVVIFMAATGILYYWKGNIDAKRAAVLSALFLATYFGHFVAFGVLAATAIVFVSLSSSEGRIRSLGWLFAACLPALAVAFVFRMSSATDTGFAPSWYVLNEPLSLSGIFLHLHAADPFVILSRRYLPFYESDSDIYALFSPLLRLLTVVFILTIAMFWGRERSQLVRRHFPHIAAMLAIFTLALAAPDEFGPFSGSILRLRLLLCGFILFIPWIDLGSRRLVSAIAAVILISIFIYQAAALWDYSLRSDRDIAEYVSASDAIMAGDAIATITIVQGARRFGSNPVRGMDNVIAVQREAMVWDDYETGYRLFPVTATREEDRAFIREFTNHNIFRLGSAEENFDERIQKFSNVLAKSDGRIDTMIVWGRDPRVEAALTERYQAEPYFENGQVRLFRNRSREISAK